MLKKFEDKTYEITPDEERAMEAVIRGLRTRQGRDKAIKAAAIVDGVNRNVGLKNKFSEVRLRKIVNYIRSHGILPVMACSNGYYVSFDKNEVKEEIESLLQRANGIAIAAHGLEKFLQ